MTRVLLCGYFADESSMSLEDDGLGGLSSLAGLLGEVAFLTRGGLLPCLTLHLSDPPRL